MTATTTALELVERRLIEVTGVPGRNGSWRCPAHDDRNASLSVRQGDKGAVLHCHAGCDTTAVLAELKLAAADLFDQADGHNGDRKPRIVDTYPYVDEHDQLLFEVVRMDPKTFRQRRPDGCGGWTWNLKGARRVLYRLPAVIHAVADGRDVFVVEGEKDVAALERAGETATCNPGGAGKWRPEHTAALAGAARVFVVADRDTPGYRHALAVCRQLLSTVGEVVVARPATGKDVADHLGSGHGVEELELLTVDELERLCGQPKPDSAAPGAAEPERLQRYLTARPAAEVSPERPVWLWTGWLACGVVAILAGRQGAGKTTWAAWLLSALTTGRLLPDDEARTPVAVGHLSLEEPDGRVVARLAAAGADLNRVMLLGQVADVDDEGRLFRRPWRLPEDCDILAQRILADQLALVVVDGLGYAVSGDSHNYANVGAALAGLANVAEQTGCTILGLTHPPKGAADPVTAAIGSTAWTAIPRLVIVLGRHPDDDDRRVVRVAKTNYREPATGYSWTIAGDDRYDAGHVDDIQACDVEAGVLVAAPVSDEARSERDEAREFLAQALADGPRTASDVKKAWRAEGGSDRTLDRARRDAGVTINRVGFGPDQRTWWDAPPHSRHTLPTGPAGATGGETGDTAPEQGQHALHLVPSDHSRHSAPSGESDESGESGGAK